MKKIIAAVVLAFVALPTFALESKAASDVTPPIITAFSITPEVIDTATGSQTLTLTMSAYDDSSDLCLYPLNDCRIDSQADLKSIGNEAADFAGFYNFQLVSGNMRNGTFTAELTLPQGSRIGPWTLQNIHIYDAVENSRIYTAWRYPSHCECGAGTNGICTYAVFSDIPGITGTVIGNSGSTDSFVIESEYQMINPDGGTKVTFPAGTTITRADGGSFEIYRLVNQIATIDGLTTAGLAGNIAEVLQLGIPDMKLSFSRPVRIDLKVPDSLDGKTLTIKSLGGGDASWVNEGSCKVDDDVCTFSVNHASYFAATTKKKVKQSKAKVKISAKKRVKSSTVRVKIKTNKYAILDIAVNGAAQKTAVASKKGKYATRVNLEAGQNVITVTASKSATTATKSRTVTRR